MTLVVSPLLSLMKDQVDFFAGLINTRGQAGFFPFF